VPADAFARFDTALRTYAESILAVRAQAEHSKVRIDGAQKALAGEKPPSVTPPRGRRRHLAQVNRPVTILSAAIWQAYVEDITTRTRIRDHRGTRRTNDYGQRDAQKPHSNKPQ
jgi:hypothetical protein